MPLYTEARIHELCAQAVAAHGESDVERIASELREALTEHIRYAKASLTVQARLFANRMRKETEDEFFRQGPPDGVREDSYRMLSS